MSSNMTAVSSDAERPAAQQGGVPINWLSGHWRSRTAIFSDGPSPRLKLLVLEGGLRRFMPRPLFWLYIVPIIVAGALGSGHVDDIAPGLVRYVIMEFDSAPGYIRDMVVKPLFTVISALLVGAAVSRSEKPEKFLVPMLISMWMMGAMVVVYVYQSGVALRELASSSSREFLSPLGLHANELGRLYEVAYALLLFTWAESKRPGLRLVLLASMGWMIVAMVLTFS